MSQPLTTSEDFSETVLLTGFPRDRQAALTNALAGIGEKAVSGETPEQLLDWIDKGFSGVVCLGEELTGAASRRLLDEAARSGRLSDLLFVVTAGRDAEPFRPFARQGVLFYLGRRALPIAELADLIESALQQLRNRSRKGEGVDRRSTLRRKAAWLESLLVDAPDQATICRLTLSAVEEAAPADLWSLWICDADGRTLQPSDDGRSPRREPAFSGIVAFAARTGRSVRIAHAASDPRYDARVDNPSNRPSPSLLAVPLLDAESRVLGVAAAVRSQEKPPFEPEDEQAVRTVLEPAVSRLERVATSAAMETFSRTHPEAAAAADLFRPEAINESVRVVESEGHLLRDLPAWTTWTYWMLLGGCLILLLYGVLGRVNEYASGPALVQTDRTDVTAVRAGNVERVLAAAGGPVSAGQPLVRFYDAEERAELKRLRREWVLRLRQRLRDPSDDSAAAALIGLRSQLELAESRLEEQIIRAPRSGVVRDVRIRPGQRMEAGQVLLSIVGERSRNKVVALLPGRFRPLLTMGQAARLELEGYPYRLHSLVVEQVGEELIGPEEARQYLGEIIADSVNVEGPVVLVEAPLKAETFEIDGRRYRYHTGMRGVVEVKIRSEPIVLSLIPALRALLETEQ